MNLWEKMIYTSNQVFSGSQLENTKVLKPKENKQPFAHLITSNKAGLILILPLVQGVNNIGSGSFADHSHEKFSLSGIVEGAQWVITNTQGKISVKDACSSNGSRLVRKKNRDSIIEKPSSAILKSNIGIIMGWDGKCDHTDEHQLEEGDILVNIYRYFLFHKTH